MNETEPQVYLSICEIVEKIASENSGTRSVFIGIAQMSFPTDVIQGTLKCLPNHLSVVISNSLTLSKKLIKINMEKSAIILSFGDEINVVRKLIE